MDGEPTCAFPESALRRKNRGLERSLKMNIPPEVYDSLEKELDKIGME